MSHKYYKIDIEFDGNYGYTEYQTLYGIENNCIDFFWLRHADGEEVVCNGTDSYIFCLAHALMLQDVDKLGDKVKITEIPFEQLPGPVRRQFDGSSTRKYANQD